MFVCLFVCLFVCVCVCFLFVCLFGAYVSLENFSLIWRQRHYRWRAVNCYLHSTLMAIEQWGFFSVPHLLWHGASVYNGHLRGPLTLKPIAKRLVVDLSLPVFTTLMVCRYTFILPFLFENLNCKTKLVSLIFQRQVSAASTTPPHSTHHHATHVTHHHVTHESSESEYFSFLYDPTSVSITLCIFWLRSLIFLVGIFFLLIWTYKINLFLYLYNSYFHSALYRCQIKTWLLSVPN